MRTISNPAWPVAMPAGAPLADNDRGNSVDVWRIPTSACTLAGFREWVTSGDFPEHVRVTFVEQEVYLDTSNESPDTHVAVKSEIGRVLGELCRKERLGKFYGDGILVSNQPAGVSHNPDAIFLSRDAIQSKRVRFVPRQSRPDDYREIEGTPDWILEVVSDSSVRKDTEQLRRAYFKAGVPEYWLLDARGAEIVFQLLVAGAAGYELAPMESGWQQSRVFGRTFRLERKRDEFDLWEYTLSIRADTAAVQTKPPSNNGPAPNSEGEV